MRLCWFGDARLGLVDGSNVQDVTAALDVLPSYRYPLPTYDVFIANLPRVAGRIRAVAADAPSMPLTGLKLLSPVANPSKVIGRLPQIARTLMPLASLIRTSVLDMYPAADPLAQLYDADKRSGAAPLSAGVSTPCSSGGRTFWNLISSRMS